MGPLVRGREARSRAGDTPLEIQFARIEVEGRSLPAAVWVALRRDDVDAAIEAMTAASETQFLIEEREEMGDGYRLRAVQDTLPMPEPELLIGQLSLALDVPVDVLNVLADWGADDPRAASEIDDLLTRRFGPVDPAAAVWQAPRPAADGTAPAGVAAGGTAPGEVAGQLTMTVAEAAQVLRLDDSQRRALAILARQATLVITMQ